MMKVDMSPEGVTQRLRTMDELWLLSVKLGNSKRVARYSQPSKKDRALKIQDSIRRILFFDWDPIGINDMANIDDEYDAYIGRVYRMLVENCSEEDLIKFLFHLERDAMGMPSRSPELLRPVAQKLIALNVGLKGNQIGNL